MAAGYTSSNASNTFCISVTKINGDVINISQLSPCMTGDDLLQLVLQKYTAFGSASLPVLSIGQRLVISDAKLEDQGIGNGAVVSFAIREINEADQRKVECKVWQRSEHLDFQDVHIWLSIRALQNVTTCRNALLHLVGWPVGLQNLTFGVHFNESMDNVKLPESLQSLTFGNFFRQSMDNVKLPERLQSLKFGFSFNHSMDNVKFPGGLQSLSLIHI